MQAEMKLEGLDGVLQTLQQLPPEIVSKRGGPVRQSLRKGAKLIVTQARINFARAADAPGKTGINQATGFTERNIVTKVRSRNLDFNGEKLVVTVNPTKHPSGKLYRRASRSTGRRNKAGPQAKQVQANDIAFFMERGTKKQNRIPWLVPAFVSRAPDAIRTIQTSLLTAIDKIVVRLAAQNKGK